MYRAQEQEWLELEENEMRKLRADCADGIADAAAVWSQHDAKALCPWHAQGLRCRLEGIYNRRRDCAKSFAASKSKAFWCTCDMSTPPLCTRAGIIGEIDEHKAVGAWMIACHDLMAAKLDGVELRQLNINLEQPKWLDQQISDEPEQSTDLNVHATVFVPSAPADTRRAELETLKLTSLQRRAKEAGVDERELEDAMDGDTPKPSIIELIVAQQAPRHSLTNLSADAPPTCMHPPPPAHCMQCALRAEWVEGGLAQDPIDEGWYCGRCWFECYGAPPPADH